MFKDKVNQSSGNSNKRNRNSYFVLIAPVPAAIANANPANIKIIKRAHNIPVK